MDYAQCMRHVLTAVDSCDLVSLLEQARLSSEQLVGHADTAAAGGQALCTLYATQHRHSNTMLNSSLNIILL